MNDYISYYILLLFAILIIIAIPVSIFYILFIFLIPTTFWEKVVWFTLSFLISWFVEVIYIAFLL